MKIKKTWKIALFLLVGSIFQVIDLSAAATGRVLTRTTNRFSNNLPNRLQKFGNKLMPKSRPISSTLTPESNVPIPKSRALTLVPKNNEVLVPKNSVPIPKNSVPIPKNSVPIPKNGTSIPIPKRSPWLSRGKNVWYGALGALGVATAYDVKTGAVTKKLDNWYTDRLQKAALASKMKAEKTDLERKMNILHSFQEKDNINLQERFKIESLVDGAIKDLVQGYHTYIVIRPEKKEVKLLEEPLNPVLHGGIYVTPMVNISGKPLDNNTFIIYADKDFVTLPKEEQDFLMARERERFKEIEKETLWKNVVRNPSGKNKIPPKQKVVPREKYEDFQKHLIEKAVADSHNDAEKAKIAKGAFNFYTNAAKKDFLNARSYRDLATELDNKYKIKKQVKGRIEEKQNQSQGWLSRWSPSQGWLNRWNPWRK